MGTPEQSGKGHASEKNKTPPKQRVKFSPQFAPEFVGASSRNRLIAGFVRFAAVARLFLNLFCRLYRLKDVAESGSAPAD